MASVRPFNKLSGKLNPFRKLISHTNRNTIMPPMAIFFTKFLICNCKGVASGLISASDLPIFPNCVLLPTAVTLKIAKPDTTVLPWKSSLLSVSLFFCNENDSPVKIDSLTEKSLE
ncbi:hypothetical protein D3C86_1732870 [compost metagenome]